MRGGITLIEIGMTAVLLAILSIPLLSLLFQQRTITQRTSIYYTAMLAAREEMGDTQFLVAAGVPAQSVAHDWSPLKGSAVGRLTLAKVLGKDPGLAYQGAQERVKTRLELVSNAGRLKVMKVSVRYEGDDAGVGTDRDGNLLSLVFTGTAAR